MRIHIISICRDISRISSIGCFHRKVHLFLNKKMTEPSLKKICNKGISIGTHDGTFHCDDALACFLLKILPYYKNSKIIRTRNENLLSQCDIVVDVGGCYDPKQHRYDHHQRSFNENMNSLCPKKPWLTKLSSAGLIYFHFGCEIIAEIINSNSEDKKTSIIYDKMYEHFIEEIDAIDNGISTHDDTPRYHISTNVSSRVKYINPPWNKPHNNIDELFENAMALVGSEFIQKVNFYNDVWWPARELVVNAINTREKIDSSKEIIELENGGCPWKDHLLTLEEELSITPNIKFVIYTDLNGMWRVQCVPISVNSFENRLSLKKEWQGLRNEELSKVSEIPDCIFVHANGFIGGNKTRKGVLEMATKTLKDHYTSNLKIS